MNIKAMWSLYSSVVPAQLIGEHGKPTPLPSGQPDKHERRKSTELDKDADILRVTELSARGS